MIAAAIACLGLSLSVMLYAISQSVRAVEAQVKLLRESLPTVPGLDTQSQGEGAER